MIKHNKTSIVQLSIIGPHDQPGFGVSLSGQTAITPLSYRPAYHYRSSDLIFAIGVRLFLKCIVPFPLV